MTSRRTLASYAIVALAALGMPSAARAQAAGFAVGRFEPASRGSDWFMSDSLDLRGKLRLSVGEVVDWTYRPLSLYDRRAVERAGIRASIIEDRVMAHTGASFVAIEGLRFGVNVPVVLYQHGDELAGLTTARAPRERISLGDVRLAADVGLFGEVGRGARLAIGSAVFFPTGSREQFTSDGTVRVMPRVLFAGDKGLLAYAASLAVALRPYDGVFEGRPLSSEAVGSAAIGFKVNDRVVFGPEVAGSTTLNREAFGRRATPVDLLFGMHVRLASHFQLGTAIGPGLTQGDGSPSMRLLALFEYAPDVCVDKDGDGVCESADACPEVSGVRSSARSRNGCPSEAAPPPEPGALEPSPIEQPKTDEPDQAPTPSETPPDQKTPATPNVAPPD